MLVSAIYGNSHGYGITADQIEAFNGKGKLEQGEGGAFAELGTLSATDDGNYSLSTTEGASYYVLSFSFWHNCKDEEGNIIVWGTDVISVTVQADDLATTVIPRYGWIDGTALDEDAEVATDTTTWLSTVTVEETTYYVWSPDAVKALEGATGVASYGMKFQYALWTAYDANGAIESMAISLS